MKKLGLIAGTSWHSTIVYYRLLNEMATDKLGPMSNPPMILYSQNIDIMRRGDHNEIRSEYLRIAKLLEDDGADWIVICANAPHLVYDHVQPQIDIPILHIADATAKKALSGRWPRLGLPGTKPVMGMEFLKERLRDKHGLEVLLPPEKHREQVHHYIAKELTSGIFSGEARAFYSERMKEFKEAGADAIILGCTELPIMFGPEDFDLPLLDTTRLHAEMAMDFIFS